ncbi:S8 family peptidase [Streptomyces phaeolivaceus]|uniref:S8 family peptidase n=1 Tax=Streptomyces phaeolivaceus TaxID=2653200 RepID=UPI001D04EC79|nr:S8 family serine peptidase [Streptomyces phaeolivaceus]
MRYAAVAATAATVALSTGLTVAGPTAAAQAAPAGTTTGSAAVPTARKAAEGTAGNPAGGGSRRIPLITGDRVILDTRNQVVGVERAKGRERVPVQVRTVGGHTLVVPMDAARLVANGKLDQRLFDVTELSEVAGRGSRQNGLKVIVGYQGTARTAKADVRDTGTLRSAFRTLNADAVRTPRQDTPELWDAVTNGGAVTRGDTLAPGVSHVWLDGIRKAALDTSVSGIGAPAAHAKGLDGKGVKVAVLDTGIDTTHPDLKNQVIAARDFTGSKDTADRVGHGTHVASIVAGTGAGSNGKYQGVAPGAKLLNAKVLGDEGGDDSSIVAGMEWAAAQGADIVNLSLGGEDTPGVDPLEAMVNKLSEEKGILFAIAAGNEGEAGDSTVDSPGSAADALTVGAVDGKGKLAYFSSRGPTVDGRLKPDVTAPGVQITAASARGSEVARDVGEKPAGYVTLSGTSMATPQVAGAAALLKQQHPDWTSAELKTALVSSAQGGSYTAFQGGAGRIRVGRAVTGTVVAEPASLDLPLQQWPHTDDTPVTRRLTYRNSGTKDITLSLSGAARDPKGKAAPAAFLTLGAGKVTVPAGGSASVDVTVNTRPGGKLDGGWSARVTATGDGQSVTTPLGVIRETEHYDLTLRYVDRPGQTSAHVAYLLSVDSPEQSATLTPEHTDDTTTLRVAPGTYMLESASSRNLTTYEGGLDWLVAPRLTVTRDMTLTLDLNKAKSPDITVPDPKARPLNAWVSYKNYGGPSGQNGTGIMLRSFADIRLAHIGPKVDSLSQNWSGQWTTAKNTEYDIVAAAPVKEIKGAYVHHYTAGEFATLKVGMGSSVPGKTGAVSLTASVPDGFGYRSGFADAVPQKLPGTRTYHVSAVEGAQWRPDFSQYSGKKDSEGNPVPEVVSSVDDYLTPEAGRTYRFRFNTAVFGPRMPSGSDSGVRRDGNTISGVLPPFTDGAGHSGDSDTTSATTTLYRDGKKLATRRAPLVTGTTFKVPAGEAAYRLTTSVRRSARLSAVSTRTDATWTFRSKKTGADGVRLPASTVRFSPATGLDGRVTGKAATFPVTVEGPAKGRNLKSLVVWASYDHGRIWKKATVTHGKVTVKNPARGKSVSLRAEVTDKKGNTSVISIYDAYYRE